MQASLAQKTIQSIDAALKSGRVTSMQGLVRLIRALSSDEGRVSIEEMADLIDQDQSILVRVIAAANTLGYNPGGVEIGSVTQAIHVIGFSRVRALAMSLVLLDHAERQTSPAEQRIMATMSLCSGMIAQVTAEHTALLSPELAFVAASLRNFGRLVLGTFMTDEFRTAVSAADAGEGDEAYRAMFGLTPLELGYELLKSANLPTVILTAVRQFELPALEDLAWTDRSLFHLASTSLELSSLVLDAKLTPEEFTGAQAKLIARVAADFPALAERLPEILETAAHRLEKFSSGPPGQSFLATGLSRLRRCIRILDSSSTGDGTEAAPPPLDLPPPAPYPTAAAPVPAPTESATPDPRPPSDAMADVLAQLEDGSANHNALPLALNALWSTLRPSSLIFCAPDADSRSFRIQLGIGPLQTELGNRTLFALGERNALALCHERLMNLSIQDTHEKRIQRHLPDWLKSAHAPRCLLALPVHHRRVLQGVLILAWDAPRDTHFGPAELGPLQKLIECVARHRNRTKARN